MQQLPCMWAEIMSYIYAPMGTYMGDYGITGVKTNDFLHVLLPKHDISYTHLPEDRAKFMQTNEMCRKFCPILQISYMYPTYTKIVLFQIQGAIYPDLTQLNIHGSRWVFQPRCLYFHLLILKL